MKWTDLKSRSYCPYSQQESAAIIKGASGIFYAGVRIENVSFPLTITAIQAAIFICISEGDIPKKLILPSDEEMELLNHWVEEFSLEVEVNNDLTDIDLFESRTLLTTSIESELKSLLPKASVMHSQFPVSCLLQLNEGFVESVNIEVKNWQLGLCAERIAIAKAYASGHTEFKSLYVHTEHGEFSSPCGACRQVIYEHLPFHDIHLYHSNGTRSKLLTVDLLPYHFKSNFLSGK